VVTGLMSVDFHGYDLVGFGDRLRTDVFVCKAREAREFIPWTVKTFERRGW
jgi:hypothetical protein